MSGNWQWPWRTFIYVLTKNTNIILLYSYILPLSLVGGGVGWWLSPRFWARLSLSRFSVFVLVCVLVLSVFFCPLGFLRCFSLVLGGVLVVCAASFTSYMILHVIFFYCMVLYKISTTAI